MARQRNRINITGIVQGVGFRPTVYSYAINNELAGTVCNDVTGVTIEVEGSREQVSAFIEQLRSAPPPLAHIESFVVTPLAPLGETRFIIVKSDDTGKSKEAAISPDMATCPDCLADIADPHNRRFRYPFTNCTNCGPRFTIVKDRPYDRHLTSMADFPLCDACRREYEDPLDRRFHAQPNACPRCGPALSLLAGDARDEAALGACISGLSKGELWAIKGLGGFNLALDPLNISAVQRLRHLKKRPNKAFALMARDRTVVEQYCTLTAAEGALLTSRAAPIVLLQKNSGALNHISPDNNRLGFLLPYTPLHHLLMEAFPVLLMTSANLRDEPLAATDEEIARLMESGLCDNALTHNRAIVHRCDDSIAQVVEETTHWLRRARGQVPVTITPEFPTGNLPDSLAMGANMKNCFALAKSGKITLSPHIGDLMDTRNLDWLKAQIDDLSSLLEVTPRRLLTDAHPGYETSRDAFLSQFPPVPRTRVFHHHAHILSVLAEHNRLGERVIGIACDGTGFGEDGTIWGCEVLAVNPGDPNARRLGHLQQFVLPGGEQAIHETDRIAIALAMTSGSDLSALPFDKKRLESIAFLVQRKLNTPVTSSAGRLFDGVSALVGACTRSEYEGRGAIRLQQLAEQWTEAISDPYPVHISTDDPRQILFAPMIRALLQDTAPPALKAARFHQWFAHSIVAAVLPFSPPLVALSGGVFQNSLLLAMVRSALNAHGIESITNSRFPLNDGGIALGQIVFPPAPDNEATKKPYAH